MNDTTAGTPPFPPSPTTPTDTPLDTSVRCIQCQCDLLGLPQSGTCPECGTPIIDSVHSAMLLYSSPDYTGKLHKGIFLIQATIVGSIILLFLAVPISFLFGMNGAGPGAVGAITQIPSFALGIVSLYGWWRLSEPDSEYVSNDTREKARGFVRIGVIIRVVLMIVGLPIALLAPPFFATAGSGSFTLTSTDYIWIALGVLGLGVWIAWFIAEMLYIKWLGVRLANARLVKRAKRFLWLGPLLSTVGIVLIGLGPLIALVLYWRMLDWVRKDLKRIRAEQVIAGTQA